LLGQSAISNLKNFSVGYGFSENLHINRGGSFSNFGFACSVYFRGHNAADYRSNNLGFRLAY
jgi:formylglycine-generating enzyme required for sulfatase activity